jgi:chromosomal replication initiation ATPase DnaA
MDLILRIVCDNRKLHRDVILQDNYTGGARKRDLVMARFWCMYFAVENDCGSMDDIGLFYGRDRCTVIHAIKKINEGMKLYSDMRFTHNEIKLAITEAKIAMAEGMLKVRLDILLNSFIADAKKITADLLVK